MIFIPSVTSLLENTAAKLRADYIVGISQRSLRITYSQQWPWIGHHCFILIFVSSKSALCPQFRPRTLFLLTLTGFLTSDLCQLSAGCQWAWWKIFWSAEFATSDFDAPRCCPANTLSACPVSRNSFFQQATVSG